jgi:signal transduction histidine kinase
VHVLNGRTGSGSFAVLYDQHGVRLGHSADPTQAFHPAAPLDPITLGNFVATRRFLDRTRELMEATIPIASYAASEDARTTPVPVAGVAAEALRKGSIELLQSIPDDLDLRFDCLVATGRPRAVVMIPLSVSRRPTGLLVVGALSPLTPEAVTTLSDLASPLALTMARRALIDHTERIARELAQRNEELHQQASALAEQGEELKAQKQELSLNNVEVQRADRLKSEFLANMSHELRTPLNAVIGFSELLLDDRKHLSAPQSEWVEHIRESGGHLLSLINSVLDLAKIEAGRMTLSVETVAPGDAVAAACALMRPTARRKNLALSTVESEAGPVKTDRGALQQVLLNLLSNAVKFSPEKGAIEVGFAPASGGVRFWVKDHGPGVDAAAQKGLFEPFFQVESLLVKRHEGTGLGLAISRRLVEQQGGTIGVESAPGNGSTFFFTLPLAEGPAQLAESEAQAGPPAAFGGDVPLTAHIPLVALTALAMRGDDERVRNAGFDDYLSKPFVRGALDAVLGRFLHDKAA